jgi:hypothetical protein
VLNSAKHHAQRHATPELFKDAIRLVAMSLNRPLVGKCSLTGVGGSYPDNSNPPRTKARRSWLDRGQPIAHEPVQQCIGETMGQHVRDGAAKW